MPTGPREGALRGAGTGQEPPKRDCAPRRAATTWPRAPIADPRQQPHGRRGAPAGPVLTLGHQTPRDARALGNGDRDGAVHATARVPGPEAADAGSRQQKQRAGPDEQ
eukprot:12818539-Alexandrium_andersonii.AAC.1